MNSIIIKGARENNLKNIDITIPRNRVTCFVGVSGSGKSTIAFDIIAKEGQRQYFESLSSYARRYLQKSNRPNVEDIEGISSTIIIGQDRLGHNPRSTVGTITESYTYLRLLYSRVGWPAMDSSYFSFNHPDGACPVCKGIGRAMEIDLDSLIDFDKSLNEGAILYSNWRVGSMAWKIIKSTGYFDMDKKLSDYSKEELDRLLYASKEVVAGKGIDQVINWTFKGVITHLKSRGNSAYRTVSEIERKYFEYKYCGDCGGLRLNKKALSVKINGLNIGEVARLPLTECLKFIKKIDHPHAAVIKPRLESQLEHLISAGVGYLSLDRGTDTLSGGEAQRVKMARQLGCDLVQTIYVLDEPTAGLHPKDVDEVVKNLKSLCNNGNTVLVVEHDRVVIKSADHIIEVGPGGGKEGGEIIAEGKLAEIIDNPRSVTAKYLGSDEKGKLKKNVRAPKGFLRVTNATKHNLKDISLNIPLGAMVALTGVSGSGKSSLTEEIISQHEDKVISIDQKQIGGTYRGCIATYVGAFNEIRKIFADTNRMSASLFSFNSRGGCEVCRGVGFIEMDMNFLGNVKIKCDKCQGTRYKEKVLRYKYKGKNIADVLNTTAEEIVNFFENIKIKNAMQMLIDVGLDYIVMGQTLDTLSGGESQRLKLASKLQKEKEFYILDEPTSGLHFADLDKLMKLLNKLVDNGNTVLVIEHNLDFIRQADWVIDLGPEGGEKGGQIVTQGTPLDITKSSKSYTAKYLKENI